MSEEYFENTDIMIESLVEKYSEDIRKDLYRITARVVMDIRNNQSALFADIEAARRADDKWTR